MSRKPQQRTTETRRRALDAVLELVAEGGARAVTFRAVSARSGVALGALTYHFPNRRDLLAAAYRHHLELLRAAAISLPTAELVEMDRSSQTNAVFAFLHSMATTDRGRYLAEFELALETSRDPELRADIEPETSSTHAMAVDLLRAAGATDPEADATIFSAAMEGLLLGWISRPDDLEHQQRARAAIARMLEMFVPKSIG